MRYILQETVLREVVVEAASEEEAKAMYARGDIPEKDWDHVDGWIGYVEEEKE